MVWRIRSNILNGLLMLSEGKKMLKGRYMWTVWIMNSFAFVSFTGKSADFIMKPIYGRFYRFICEIAKLPCCDVRRIHIAWLVLLTFYVFLPFQVFGPILQHIFGNFNSQRNAFDGLRGDFKFLLELGVFVKFFFSKMQCKMNTCFKCDRIARPVVLLILKMR